MKPRTRRFLIVLAVFGVLLGGCGAPADPQPVAGDVATTEPSPETTAATTEPAPAPEVTTAAPVATVKPAPKPTVTTPKDKPAPKDKPKPKPTVTKKPTATKPPSSGNVVHPGAFCSPEGATGRTSKGTKMRCTRKAGEDRARWRAA